MKSIYIGVCKTREFELFNDSLNFFMTSISNKYKTYLNIVEDTFLPDAQNYLAKEFLNSGFDYLLLLDDDQWGHTADMLDTLVGANTYVSTIRTYSRHYPYVCAVWNKVGHNALVSLEDGQGYVQCDLTGFPMTLVSRETFKYLEEPYFRPLEAEGRMWNSDVDFFERLAVKGIKPTACFQHCLNHDKITQDNVFRYRNEERFENNNLARLRVLQMQGA